MLNFPFSICSINFLTEADEETLWLSVLFLDLSTECLNNRCVLVNIGLVLILELDLEMLWWKDGVKYPIYTNALIVKLVPKFSIWVL